MLLLCSIIATFLSSPIFLTILVIIFIFITCIYINIFSFVWLSFSLIIIFLGGIIILFTYLAALSSREKIFIFLEFKQIFIPINLFIINSLLFIFSKNFSIIPQNLQNNLKQIYFLYWKSSTLFLTFILLLSLLIFVKVVEIYKGPLKFRNFYYTNS